MYQTIINPRNQIIIVEHLGWPLDDLKSKIGSHPGYDPDLALPRYNIWPDMTYAMMLRSLSLGFGYTKEHVPLPPKYFILRASNPSPELVAITKVFASQISNGQGKDVDDIPEYPGRTFSIGSLPFNAALSQLECRYSPRSSHHKSGTRDGKAR